MEIGWIGPGKLGLAMGAMAVKAGHKVNAYVRSPEKVASVIETGVAAVSFDQAAGYDHVFTCLPDDKTLDTVSVELLAKMKKGSILAETNTVSAAVSAEIAERAAKHGIQYLRAPVSGNPIVVSSGKATILASGPRAAFDAVKPVFASFAPSIYYLGEGEQSRVVKLAINLMLAVSVGTLGEAMALAVSSGIEQNAFLDILASTAQASPFMLGKINALKADNMTPTFTGQQMSKDLDLAIAEANRAGLPAPLTALVRTQFATLKGQGTAEQDFVAVAKLASSYIK